MARIPDGATLIDNPVSSAPGFQIENVYVMAGVPNIFQAMLASVLPGLTGGAPLLSLTVKVNRGEGDIAGPLKLLSEQFSELNFGSYPFQIDGVYGSNIVVRGTDISRLEAAASALRTAFAGDAE